jgi:hypothetical protein
VVSIFNSHLDEERAALRQAHRFSAARFNPALQPGRMLPLTA